MSIYKEEFHFYKCLKANISTKAEMILFSLFLTEKINEIELEFKINCLDNDIEPLQNFEFFTRRFVPNCGTIGQTEIIKYIDTVQEKGYMKHIIKYHRYLFNILCQFFVK